MKKKISILFAGIILLAVMVVNVQSSIKNDGSSIILNLSALSQITLAHAEGQWDTVLYTTYPPEINCSGSGPLECVWPQ